MRVAFWLLAGLALLAVTAARPYEDDSNEEDIDYLEDVEMKKQKGRGAAKKSRVQEDEEDEDLTDAGSEGESGKAKEKAKTKTKPKETPKGENGDGPILICNEKDGEDEACHCENNEVFCNGVYFDDDDGDSLLNTLDVRLAKQKNKEFKPIIAYFKDNAITSIKKNRLPEGMEESLALLDLMNNRISRIEAGAFQGFKNISKLILTDNRIKDIRSEYFSGDIATTLHTLDLRKNRLTKLKDSPFERLVNLKKLVLDENDIQLDENTFKGLENLEILSMDDCGLLQINASILLPLKKLKQLSIRANPFTDVPKAVGDLATLEVLDLSESKITEIHEDSFSDDAEITEILIEDMPYLNRIDNCAFCGVEKLKTVSLTKSSKLSSIHPNAFGFEKYEDERVKSLKLLKMAYTNISNIPVDLLDWSTMETVELLGTPLNCTCDQASLIHLMPEGDLPNTRCAYPPELKKKSLAAVSEEMCPNSHRTGRFFMTLASVLLACVACSILFVLFRRGYRFHIPARFTPSAPVAYSNLHTNTDEDTQGLQADFASSSGGHDNDMADFKPRPAAV